MSENLDLVRSIFADWERRDFSSAPWADPDMEMQTIGAPGDVDAVDPAERANSLRDFLSMWDDYCVEAESLRELEDGRVLVLIREHGRGKSSGLDLEQVGGRR